MKALFWEIHKNFRKYCQVNNSLLGPLEPLELALYVSFIIIAS